MGLRGTGRRQGRGERVGWGAGPSVASATAIPSGTAPSGIGVIAPSRFTPSRFTPALFAGAPFAGALFAGALLIVGCGGAGNTAGVSALDDRGGADTTPHLPGSAEPHTTSEPTGAGSSDAEETPDADRGELQSSIVELLARYDAAISALYAEPLAAADDRHPLTVAWLEVVVDGSQLDREVRGRIIASATDDSMAIVAGPDGVSFRNTPTGVQANPDGSISWTNCGYAPGIGIDMRTGEVLDDNRTSTVGRGTAVRAPDGALVVSELWDDETRLLAPGEPDPCPALAADEDDR